MIPATRRVATAECVDSYMRRYMPRLVELGFTTPNIAKSVRRDIAAARALMKESKC